MRVRVQRSRAESRSKRAPSVTPMPMPSFAPLLRPGLGFGVLGFVAEAEAAALGVLGRVDDADVGVVVLLDVELEELEVEGAASSVLAGRVTLEELEVEEANSGVLAGGVAPEPEHGKVTM